MISRRSFVVSLAVGTLLATALPFLAKSRHSSLLAMLDTDHDGTVDLAEAKAAINSTAGGCGTGDSSERDKLLSQIEKKSQSQSQSQKPNFFGTPIPVPESQLSPSDSDSVPHTLFGTLGLGLGLSPKKLGLKLRLELGSES